MMGSVSRPNRARATCTSAVTGKRTLWIGAALASRMGICIVRTGGRLSTCADACTIEPRLDVAALPESLARALSLALSFVISALRVLRPIQRKTVAHKPLPKIRTTDRAGRDRAVILIEADWNTIDGTVGNEGVKVVRGLRPATILQAVVATAQLTALRCIDSPKPDARSMHLQRVAVDHAGLSDKIAGQRHARQNGENQSDSRSMHSNDHVATAILADRISLVLAPADSLAASDNETPYRAANVP